MSRDRSLGQPFDSDDDLHPVERLVDEFSERQRNGEHPTIEEYVERYPDLATDIRDVFPALLAVERFKSDVGDDSAHAAPEEITSLGDFRVLGTIGRGGMGVVYEAEEVTLRRRVALKVLPREAVADRSRIQRFEREAQTAARLHHTNIVPIFGTGEADGHYFYVMQLIRGVGLDLVVSALRGQPTAPLSRSTESMLDSVVSQLRPADDSETQTSGVTPVPSDDDATFERPSHPNYFRNVARIGSQIARALDYAHAQGTLHRDIKPANLLLDQAGTAWITDFGLAKALEQVELTRSGDVIGTLRYMAPEQLEGAFDALSDIHALGLTLYELATLDSAYRGKSRAELLANIGNGQIAPVQKVNPAVPRDLATIIEKACARAPADRYASAAQLDEDLVHFVRDEPIRARPVSMVEAVWRWGRRNRAVAASAAIALVAVFVAAAVGWVGYAITQRALTDAKTQAEEARSAHQLALANGELARANLALSLEAFEVVFREISAPDAFVSEFDDSDEDVEYVLVSTSSASPEDLALLQHILRFYERFAENNSGQPEVAWDTAAAYRTVGSIQHRLGDLESADRAYRRALTLLESASGVSLDAVESRCVTAMTHNQLARTMLDRDRWRDASDHHEIARKILQALPEESPLVQLELANMYIALGVATNHGRRGPGPRPGGGPPTRRPPIARGELVHFARARAILERLSSSDPNHPEVRFLLARALRMSGPPGPPSPRDLAMARRAIELLTALTTEYPAVERFQFELAITLTKSTRRGRPDQTARAVVPARRADLDRAIEILRELALAHRSVPAYSGTLAEAEHELGLDCWARGDLPRAESLLAAAVGRWHELMELRPGVRRNEDYWLRAVRAQHRLLHDMDRPQDARDLARECVDAFESAIGQDSAPGSRSRILTSLYRALIRSLDELGEDEAASAARTRVSLIQSQGRDR